MYFSLNKAYECKFSHINEQIVDFFTRFWIPTLAESFESIQGSKSICPCQMLKNNVKNRKNPALGITGGLTYLQSTTIQYSLPTTYLEQLWLENAICFEDSSSDIQFWQAYQSVLAWVFDALENSFLFYLVFKIASFFRSTTKRPLLDDFCPGSFSNDSWTETVQPWTSPVVL